ncbi:MAG: protein jag [Lachnospiraceae bacterium]|nr:protein jag [Ruminococcus sp.]MCM1274473.1 protein jag [Lachnospiraceae bacterium]
MVKEFTAKTLEEAKALAAEEFGVSADEIDFEILEQPRKTLFGGLKGEARVKAVYLEAASDGQPAAEESKPAETVEAAAEDAAPEEDGGELPENFDVSGSLKVKMAVEYLTDVLHALGLEKFEITPIKRDGNVVLNITGEKLGIVIGKRGETLDSLQYLTILASNRSEESYCRISLDCNDYRDKRRETLVALAGKTSAKVIKQGRRIALEPMNPYERRIIHSCVAEIEGVSSRSTGTEPYRKVVIYADKPKFDNRRRGNRRSSDGASTRSYRQSSGFSTSFEREYKRKQYQPDENANAGEFSKETVDTEKNAALYGKIEL